jgi:predicted nucleic acid-binding protein
VAYLIDTSILVRLANKTDVQHGVAKKALAELHRRGEVLHLAPQALIEFRNVATRPIAVNGLGLPITTAEADAVAFESAFSLLPESPGIFAAWKAIVGALAIIGKQVHDARLLAVCHVNGVTHLLTSMLRTLAEWRDSGPE